MRMVVDLPAPLLPRKPKISPRCDVERQVVDGDELRRSAASGRGRRWRASRGMALSCVMCRPTRALEPRLGEAGVGDARACDRARPAAARSARRARRCSWRRRRAKRSPTTRRASAARADAVCRGGDRRAARVELEPALLAPRTSSCRSNSAIRASSGPRARPRPRPARPRRRPPSQSDQLTLTDASHESCHVVRARKDARVRPRVVVAAVDADLRPAAAARRVARARATPSTRSSSARRSGRCARASASSAVDVCRWRGAASSAAPRLDRPTAVDADQAPKIRLGDCRARCAPRSPARAGATRCASADSTSFGGISPWSSRLRRSRTCASMLSSDRATHLLGLARGDQRPERARDLEPQIGARRGEVLAGRVALGARGALERVVPAAGVDRPLQVEPRPVVVGTSG